MDIFKRHGTSVVSVFVYLANLDWLDQGHQRSSPQVVFGPQSPIIGPLVPLSLDLTHIPPALDACCTQCFSSQPENHTAISTYPKLSRTCTTHTAKPSWSTVSNQLEWVPHKPNVTDQTRHCVWCSPRQARAGAKFTGSDMWRGRVLWSNPAHGTGLMPFIQPIDQPRITYPAHRIYPPGCSGRSRPGTFPWLPMGGVESVFFSFFDPEKIRASYAASAALSTSL